MLSSSLLFSSSLMLSSSLMHRVARNPAAGERGPAGGVLLVAFERALCGAPIDRSLVHFFMFF